MYESPISLKVEKFVDNVQRATQGQILYKVREIVDVDKDELLRALKYDRDQYFKGYKDGKRDAQKWISVKDRLPEDGERVLTLDEYGDIRIEQYGEQEYDWFDDGTGLNSMTTILYWMPLPEPPEVEE